MAGRFKPGWFASVKYQGLLHQATATVVYHIRRRNTFMSAEERTPALHGKLIRNRGPIVVVIGLISFAALVWTGSRQASSDQPKADPDDAKQRQGAASPTGAHALE